MGNCRMNEFLISTEISDTEMIEGCIASYSYDDNDIRRGTQHVMLLALELTHPNTNLRFSNSNEDDDSENDSSSDSSSHAGAHDYDHQKDRSDDDEGENDGGDE
ncbi:hypothetical protein Tco_0271616 [Tanacetum coccineum]